MNLFEGVTRIIMVPTWRCNLKCHYCDYRTEIIEQDKSYRLKAFGHEWVINEEMHWAYWLATLSKFRPYHLSFTGGEPTLWNGLPEFIEHFPKSCSWDITSNTLNEYAIDKVIASNIKTWTASYHYHSTEKFIQNIKILRQKGFPVSVTLVVTPDNLDKVKAAIETFNKHFIRVNIHKLLKQGFSWKGHEGIIKELKEIIKKIDSEKLIYMVDTIRDEYQKDGPVEKCQAGKNYFLAFPNGNIYRCYSHALSEGFDPIAEVSNLELSTEPMPCPGGCVFPCDIECQTGNHLDQFGVRKRL